MCIRDSAETDPRIAQLWNAERQAWVDSDDARDRLKQTEAAITTATRDLARDLNDGWDRAYPHASGAAETIRAGAGRFGRGRAEVNAARENLTSWARGWQPILTDVTGLPAGALLDPDQLATRMPFNGSSALHEAIGRYAEHAAGQAHPELGAIRHGVQVADQHVRNANGTRTAAENGCRARAVGIAYMLICDLHAVTDRPEFWVRLARGVLGVPTDRLMERTTPVERHPGGQLIGVEQRAGGQAGDVGQDGLPASGPAGEVLAG